MIVRPVTLDDAAEMTVLLNEIVQIGGTTALLEPVTQKATEDFIIKLRTTGCIHVACDDETGVLLGYQSLEYYADLPRTLGIIATFSRVGGVQRGVGTALFAATRAAAPALGFSEIDATIRADNIGGLAYYSKMGFQDHSIAKPVQLKNGPLIDRLSKRLLL